MIFETIVRLKTLKMSHRKPIESSQTFEQVIEEFSQLNFETKRKKKQKYPKSHNYKYLLIIDFEATCWDPSVAGNKKIKQEIIEFPACLLNLHSGIIEDEFRSYCKPVEQPILSGNFCEQL